MPEAPATGPKRRCTATRRDGQPCQAPAISRTGAYCFAHDPERQAERDAARSKGGTNSANVVRLRGLMPPRLISVYDELEMALQEVHNRKLAPQRATAMAALASAMVRVLQAGELEERLRKLEAGVPAQAPLSLGDRHR